MEAREAYIALNMMEGIGPVSVRALAAALGSPEAIFNAEPKALRQVSGIGPALVEKIIAQRPGVDVAGECRRAQQSGARLVTPADAEYPRALSQIHDPPLALYVFGALAPGDRRAVGMVGTRHPTHYGRDTAEKLAFQLAQAGLVVVSGLARGIDTAAHRGALKGGGRTLAVLGGALDCMYPAENIGLAREVAAQGAVISEFPFGRQPDKTTFPMRNRIISGLSLGVLVVEAGPESGALITAHQALDQGRTVFAVPGRIDSPASRGAHQLLKQGARLVESVEDILEEFEFLLPPERRPRIADAETRPRPPLAPDEERLVRALEAGEQEVDQLIRATGLSAAAVGALLIGLEMKRVARMLPGRRVELRR